MSRVLILHALLGTGHLSAARALEAAFRQASNSEPLVEDSLDFINPALSSFWKRGYKEFSERAAGLYSRLYQQADADDAAEAAFDNLRSAELGRVFFRRMERYVAELQPAAVIAVMPIPLALMSQLKQAGKLACPLYAVITDYVAHSTWIVPGVKRYFVPSSLTAELLHWRGMDPATFQVTGIPIKLEVATPKDPAAMRERHGLPHDRPLVTIFGGGVDPVRVRFIVATLLERQRPLTLVVAAGRNEQLLARLADLAGNPAVRLHKLGLIDYVDDLVAASDLVVSKPGGLITSEVLARGTPLITIEPLPGQEEPNADVVGAAGAGISLRVTELAPAAVLYLLDEPEVLARMRSSAQRIGRPRAALDIVAQVSADLAQ